MVWSTGISRDKWSGPLGDHGSGPLGDQEISGLVHWEIRGLVHWEIRGLVHWEISGSGPDTHGRSRLKGVTSGRPCSGSVG